jgi:hypothetical protein
VRGTLTDSYRGLGEAIAFRKAYTKLIEQYRLGKRIGERYTAAANCLNASLEHIQRIKGSQKIHAFMDAKHLEGLVLALQGEGKFWQFNVTDQLPQLIRDVETSVKGDAKLIGEYLVQCMGVSQEERDEVWDCLVLYDNIEAGMADTLKLFQQAADLCRPGRDAKHIAKRIREIQR